MTHTHDPFDSNERTGAAELRERMRHLFAECIWQAAPVRHARGKISPDEFTDAAMTIVREALLSRPALVALTTRLVDVANERAGIDDDTWPDDYNDLQVMVMMGESEAGMSAAFDAITGKE